MWWDRFVNLICIGKSQSFLRTPGFFRYISVTAHKPKLMCPFWLISLSTHMFSSSSFEYHFHNASPLTKRKPIVEYNQMDNIGLIHIHHSPAFINNVISSTQNRCGDPHDDDPDDSCPTSSSKRTRFNSAEKND